MDALLTWWRSRELREQRVLAIGALLAAAILIFALLAPLATRVNAAEQRLARKQDDLRWLESAAPQVMASGPGITTPVTADNALVIIDRIARETGLGNSVSQVSPAGKNQYQASLREAPFDNVVAWLARMRQQHGITTVGLSINPAAPPGTVNAAVQLQIAAR